MALITEDVELEYGLLYAVLKNGADTLRDLKGLLEEKDFSMRENKLIYSKLVSIYDAEGSLPNHTGFFKILLSENYTEDERAKIKLSIKRILKAVIGKADVALIAKKVREYRCRRELIKLFTNSVQDAEKETFDDVLAVVSKGIHTIRTLKESNIFLGSMGIIGMLDQRQQYALDVKTNPAKNGLITTGFRWLDAHIPPHSPGNLVIYQARTNVGKSMFLMSTALHNWLNGLKVLIITIEMNEYDYAFRIDSNLTNFKHEEFASGKITDAVLKMQHWGTKIKSCDKGQGDLVVYWVPERCTPDKIDNIIGNHPFKPDLVIVDYAGDMKAGLRGVADYTPTAQAEIYSRLKEIAGKYKLVLYTAQQTKRGVKSIDTESGSWSDVASHKADIMIALEKTKDDELESIKDPKYGNMCDRMTARIVKGRNVPKVTTRLYERFARMSWFEVEEDPNNSFKEEVVDNKAVTEAEYAPGEEPVDVPQEEENVVLEDEIIPQEEEIVNLESEIEDINILEVQ